MAASDEYGSITIACRYMTATAYRHTRRVTTRTDESPSPAGTSPVSDTRNVCSTEIQAEPAPAPGDGATAVLLTSSTRAPSTIKKKSTIR